jgi:NADH dehydrogenase FAD-containing subunit
VGDVRIRVVELMDHVLSTYDRAIGRYTAEVFRRNGIDLVLNSRVSSVGADAVSVVGKDGVKEELPFGACVWATGESVRGWCLGGAAPRRAAPRRALLCGPPAPPSPPPSPPSAHAPQASRCTR